MSGSSIRFGVPVRVLAGELTAYAGRWASVEGWLHARRQLGGVTFLILRDRSGMAQAVVSDPGLLEVLAGVQVESVLRVIGRVVEDARARGGAELQAEALEVLAKVSEPLPFEVNKPVLQPALDVWLDRAALALRHERKRAAQRVMAEVARGFREALLARDFVEAFTPKLVGSATEGGANVFPVEYFGRPAFLAQSPQLYKQMLVGAHERVFEVGPVFRAEPHATTRHLNEYVSLDIEFGYIDDHRDVMRMAQAVLGDIMAGVAERCADELALHGAAVPTVGEIPVVGFREAQAIILREHGEDCHAEPDLAPRHERWLGAWAAREHDSDWLFVEGYPTAKRPFYTMPSLADPAVSNSFDLLFRGLELITGGQREHRHDRLLAVMAERGIDPAPFAGYLDAFRFGMPPEGGFAAGLERFVAQLLGARNVREVTAFPRDIHRLAP